MSDNAIRIDYRHFVLRHRTDLGHPTSGANKKVASFFSSASSPSKKNTRIDLINTLQTIIEVNIALLILNMDEHRKPSVTIKNKRQRVFSVLKRIFLTRPIVASARRPNP